MRPLRLTLQAFGPFAGTEVIDFTRALDAGVFGIYGPTGAGKTSIFDGIAYALFGKSAGDERTAGDMVSLYKTIDTLTEVELVFDLGEKRYVIRRIPEQVRKAVHSDKPTAQKHEAYLFDATGLSLSEITDTNCGDIIEEKKVTLVDAYIEEMLGYEAAQFRQIVLLPQGEFREILTAKSDDRSAIMRRLFDVSVYEALSLRMREKASRMKKDIEARRGNLQAILDNEDCETEHVLTEKIDVLASELAQLTKDTEKQNTVVSQHEKVLSSASALEGQFAELDTAKNNHELLKEEEAHIGLLRPRLIKAHAARMIVPLENSYKKSKGNLADAQTALNVAETKHQTAGLNDKKAKGNLETEIGNDAKREHMGKVIDQLEQHRSKLTHANALKAPSEAANVAFIRATSDAKQASQQFEDTNNALTILKQDRPLAISHYEKLRQAKTDQDWLVAEAEKAGKFDTATTTRDQTKQNVGRHLATHQQSLSSLNEAKQKFTNAEAALANVQAVHLAHKLTDGAPCPVCGSADHPTPATGDTASAGLDDAFDAAKLAYDKASNNERVANENLYREQTRLEERETALSQLTVPERGSAVLVDLLASKKMEIEELDAVTKFANLEERITSTETSLEAHQTTLEGARSELSDAKSIAAVAASEFKNAINAIPEDFRDAERIESEITTNTKTLKQSNKAKQDAIELERNCTISLTSAKTECDALQAERNREEASYVEERTKYMTALAEISMSDEQFQLVKLDIEMITELETEIREFEDKQVRNQSLINRLNELIRDQTRPDMTALAAAKGMADQELKRINQEATGKDTLLQRLNTISASLAIKSSEIKAMEEEFKPLGLLANLVNGDNDVKIPLTDFAIASMMDEILVAANRRLMPMTGDRYQLHRPEEREGGRGKRGLDVVVYDANNEKSRPTHTLSGGEGFQASLALALGLSDVVQQNSGGIKLDAIFIDEGFGTLDSNNLDIALETLCRLGNEKRAVGVISHMEQVKELITEGFDVRETASGSHINIRASAT